MQHPLSDKAFQVYLLWWVVVMIAHIIFLHLYFKIDLDIAVIDSFVFNILTAGFGFSYWFVVKFLSPERQRLLNNVISHSFGILAGVLITTSISQYIITSYSGKSEHLVFIEEAFVWKGILATMYLIIITMIYYLLQYNYHIRLKEKNEDNLKNMLRHSELEMLKFQLNPHFIFNSLNSISALTITNPMHAQEMVIKLSEFLRSSLSKEKKDLHSLSEEIKQMQTYLEIEKVRFGERIKTDFKVPKELVDRQVPNMILQPIYENAVKYGIYGQLENVLLKTEVSSENGNVVIKVTNNFNSSKTLRKGQGIGLKNVAERLKLIYGEDHLVQVKNENATFEVILIIPQR